MEGTNNRQNVCKGIFLGYNSQYVSDLSVGLEVVADMGLENLSL